MSNYLITGTSRGIGFELARQLSQLPSSQVGKIFAISRKSSPALDELVTQTNGRVVVVATEITDAAKLQQAVKQVEGALDGKGLDVLINNAGQSAMVDGGIKAWDAQSMLDIYQTNVVGAHLTTVAFFPLLEQGREKKVINISSSVGSIGMSKHFSHAYAHAYKMSKAAMNMMGVLYAREHADQGFTFLLISPGYLRTQMPGGERGHLDVDVGVKAVLDIVLKADKSMNGKFVNVCVDGWEKEEDPTRRYDGAEIEW